MSSRYPQVLQLHGVVTEVLVVAFRTDGLDQLREFAVGEDLHYPVVVPTAAGRRPSHGRSSYREADASVGSTVRAAKFLDRVVRYDCQPPRHPSTSR